MNGGVKHVAPWEMFGMFIAEQMIEVFNRMFAQYKRMRILDHMNVLFLLWRGCMTCMTEFHYLDVLGTSLVYRACQ
jgi:hypothetical protein